MGNYAPDEIDRFLDELSDLFENGSNYGMKAFNNLKYKATELTDSIIKASWQTCVYFRDSMETLNDEPFYEKAREYVVFMNDKDMEEVSDEELQDAINDSYNAYATEHFVFDKDKNTNELDVKVELI